VDMRGVNPAIGKPYGSLVVMPAGEWAFGSLALGSALALFVYPHAVTGVFAAKRRNVITRNAAMLPAYSLVLFTRTIYEELISPNATPARRHGWPGWPRCS
jgi:solute:Na+ symporter, SSS family